MFHRLIKQIDITGPLHLLDDTIMLLMDDDKFHLAKVDQITEVVRGIRHYQINHEVLDLFHQYLEVEKNYDLNVKTVMPNDLTYDVVSIKDTMLKNKQALETLDISIKALKKEIFELNEALIQIENIENLDISLDDLFQTKYLSARFGKLPKDSLERLKYYKHKPFVFIELKETIYDVWCMYFMANSYEREIDNLMASLFFTRSYIPNFVHGKPSEAKITINTSMLNKSEMLQEKEKVFTQLKCEQNESFSLIKGKLEQLVSASDYLKHVLIVDQKFLIYGFIKKKYSQDFKVKMEKIEGIETSIKPTGTDKRIQVQHVVKSF